MLVLTDMPANSMCQHSDIYSSTSICLLMDRQLSIYSNWQFYNIISAHFTQLYIIMNFCVEVGHHLIIQMFKWFLMKFSSISLDVIIITIRNRDH